MANLLLAALIATLPSSCCVETLPMHHPTLKFKSLLQLVVKHGPVVICAGHGGSVNPFPPKLPIYQNSVNIYAGRQGQSQKDSPRVGISQRWCHSLHVHIYNELRILSKINIEVFVSYLVIMLLSPLYLINYYRCTLILYNKFKTNNYFL